MEKIVAKTGDEIDVEALEIDLEEFGSHCTQCDCMRQLLRCVPGCGQTVDGTFVIWKEAV